MADRLTIGPAGSISETMLVCRRFASFPPDLSAEEAGTSTWNQSVSTRKHARL